MDPLGERMSSTFESLRSLPARKGSARSRTGRTAPKSTLLRIEEQARRRPGARERGAGERQERDA